MYFFPIYSISCNIKSHVRSNIKSHVRSHVRQKTTHKHLKWSASEVLPKQTPFYHQQLYRFLEYYLLPPKKTKKKITKGQFLVIQLPCCGHYVHTECFKTWASISHTESIVRCAYCRTPYPYEDKCFLCLQENTKKTICTNCCHSKVHFDCTTDVIDLVILLNFEHTLECGQLVHCNCLWTGV